MPREHDHLLCDMVTLRDHVTRFPLPIAQRPRASPPEGGVASEPRFRTAPLLKRGWSRRESAKTDEGGSNRWA